MTELLRYVSIDDCGVVMNQTLLEGQIWGGLLQGLGQVFGELCVYGEDGQMLTGSFMDYAMPHADLVRRVTIRTVLVPSPEQPARREGRGRSRHRRLAADGDERHSGRAAPARGHAARHAGLRATGVAGLAGQRSHGGVTLIA